MGPSYFWGSDPSWPPLISHTEYNKNKLFKQHNDWMHKCLPRDAIHSAVFAVMRCPSVCHVDVSKRQILLSNFFIAWWPHHSSFPKGDPTLKFRLGHPRQGRQIEVGIPKICYFQPVFQKYRYRYRIPRYFKIPIPKIEPTWKKYRRKYRIPIPTPNTDTDPALRNPGIVNGESTQLTYFGTYWARPCAAECRLVLPRIGATDVIAEVCERALKLVDCGPNTVSWPFFDYMYLLYYCF